MGDINGDHLEDVVIGGASGHPTIFYVQQSGGTFSNQKIVAGTDSSLPATRRGSLNKLSVEEGVAMAGRLAPDNLDLPKLQNMSNELAAKLKERGFGAWFGGGQEDKHERHHKDDHDSK